MHFIGQVLKNIIPVVMASVVAIYGLVVAVLILNGFEKSTGTTNGYTLTKGYMDFGAGITCGLSGKSLLPCLSS